MSQPDRIRCDLETTRAVVDVTVRMHSTAKDRLHVGSSVAGYGAVMVTSTTTETQRRNSLVDSGASSMAASNNATPAVKSESPEEKSVDESEKQAPNATPTIDDIRAKSFKGLNFANRPLLWRILLGLMNYNDPSAWPESLQEKRAQYHRWRRECQTVRSQPPPEQKPEETKPQETPVLTRKDSQPFARDASLLREIEKDVSRTQSELPFFSDGGMQQQWMLRILFVYAKLNPDLGYMQGMNEILAPLVFVFGSDENEEWANETEADAFYAFTEIMNSAKLLYSKSPRDPSKTGVDTQMTRLTVLLRQHDALLWQHLNSIGLSPDFYSFRWYMTLLAREFPMASTLRIWDALLADPKRFSFLHYVCCALLRSQRTKLLNEGFSGALKLLQSLPVVDVEPLLLQAQQMRDKDRSTDHTRRLSIGSGMFTMGITPSLSSSSPRNVTTADVN